MTDQKISELADGSPLLDTDNFVIERSAADNYRIAGSAVASYVNTTIGGSYVLKAGDTMVGALTAPNFISNVATGTQPYAATSTTVNTNLNADLLDGQHASAFQAAGNYITALTGDVTATGPGSVAATLATVNADVGSFGSATQVSTFTVNAKGLITAASNTAIQIAESQVTNLVTDLAGKLTTTLASTNIFVGNGSNVATAVAMSGDATLANTGAITIANDAVTFAKMQNIATNSLLGRFNASTGDIEVVGLGAGFSFSAGNLIYTETGTGTVTSVALAAPSIFTVSGSPVTTSGTLTFALATQAANIVFAGPTAGGAAAPTFRSLVSADIPDLSATYLSLAAGGTVAGAVTFGSTVTGTWSDTAVLFSAGGVISTDVGNIYYDYSNGILGLGDTSNLVYIRYSQNTELDTDVIKMIQFGADLNASFGGNPFTITWKPPSKFIPGGQLQFVDTAGTYFYNIHAGSYYGTWAGTAIALGSQVSGDLPLANIAQIAGLSVLGVTGSSTADVAAITAGSDHQVLRRSGSAINFGSINLASTNAVTGTLPVGNGGTGATAFTAGSVVFAGTSGVYTQDNSNFFWDNTNNRLGIGTSSPAAQLHLSQQARIALLGLLGDFPSVIFNGYFDGSNIVYVASDSAFQMTHSRLTDDKLYIQWAADGTAGNTISWSTGFAMDKAGSSMFSVNTTTISGNALVQFITTTTYAKACIELDQDDTDMPFIYFSGNITTGTSTSISTSALGTYYGKAQVTVGGVGRKWMALYND